MDITSKVLPSALGGGGGGRREACASQGKNSIAFPASSIFGRMAMVLLSVQGKINKRKQNHYIAVWEGRGVKLLSVYCFIPRHGKDYKGIRCKRI